MHPVLKTAFEVAYLPKGSEHKGLPVMDFTAFFDYAIGEETLAKLTSDIKDRISELRTADASISQILEDLEKGLGMALANLFLKNESKAYEQSYHPEADIHKRPTSNQYMVQQLHSIH